MYILRLNHILPMVYRTAEAGARAQRARLPVTGDFYSTIKKLTGNVNLFYCIVNKAFPSGCRECDRTLTAA